MNVYCGLLHSTYDAYLRLCAIGGEIWVALDEVVAFWAVGGVEGHGLITDISVRVCVIDVDA